MRKGVVKYMHRAVEWPGLRALAAVLRLKKRDEYSDDERPPMCVRQLVFRLSALRNITVSVRIKYCLYREEIVREAIQKRMAEAEVHLAEKVIEIFVTSGCAGSLTLNILLWLTFGPPQSGRCSLFRCDFVFRKLLLGRPIERRHDFIHGKN
jgi:hypothetical protein